MELNSDFVTFLSDIRPTESQNDDMKSGHRTLRDRLNSFDSLKDVIVSDFLQGSYRRSTAVRPKSDRRSDVDVIVVTRLAESQFSPAQAMDEFKPFLDEYYKGKWRPQGRSFGIELSYVDLDMVVTSAPSESEEAILKSLSVTTDDDVAEARDWRLNESWLSLDRRHLSEAAALIAKANTEPEWKISPLRIPDRDANVWESTHPLEQIRWTRDKNSKTNRHFVNVVKAIKWWRLANYEEPKHPKGFPLERLVGECCPDAINSVAAGVVYTLEDIVSRYAIHVQLGTKPMLPDYGVPAHDVFSRVTSVDFKAFYDQAQKAAILSRRAFDSTDRTESGNLWRELFGSKFPEPPSSGGGSKGYTPPTGPAIPGSGRFA